ncbi:tyrosine-protein phosphatase RLPH2-like [Phragmites australis]|uniref:tyrosine-protein phosphatase RLPH2-like n=1 Tax=Phragmites australis TaxID=29695 RepID=UPI002D78C169|nr:tyrosine-protein phosphatase RLPH2-like [Phragmites australis]
MDAPPSNPPRTVICVGDVHGHILKLESLWSNLQSALPADAFATALVVFLGDYNDRGPHTRRVLDFLLALPARHPAQRHVFLCGNHDLAFAAFIGETILGISNLGELYKLPNNEYNIYRGANVIIDLAKAAPEEHKSFLRDLVWIHEEENVPVDTDEGQIVCKLIAVHAGLERSMDLNEQLRVLRTKDTRVPKVQMLSGRQDVWDIPKDLSGKQTVIVSGHHGKLHIDGLRFIIDESGGYEDKPIAAIVFPSKTLIRSTEGAASQN